MPRSRSTACGDVDGALTGIQQVLPPRGNSISSPRRGGAAEARFLSADSPTDCKNRVALTGGPQTRDGFKYLNENGLPQVSTGRERRSSVSKSGKKVRRNEYAKSLRTPRHSSTLAHLRSTTSRNRASRKGFVERVSAARTSPEVPRVLQAME